MLEGKSMPSNMAASTLKTVRVLIKTAWIWTEDWKEWFCKQKAFQMSWWNFVLHKKWQRVLKVTLLIN